MWKLKNFPFLEIRKILYSWKLENFLVSKFLYIHLVCKLKLENYQTYPVLYSLSSTRPFAYSFKTSQYSKGSIMLGEVRFSNSIPSAYESKVITVHLYCLIILWLTLILYTIYKQQSVYYHYFSALSSDNHNMLSCVPFHQAIEIKLLLYTCTV